MAYKFFVIPLQNVEQQEEALNGFLRSHRVLTVDRRWVDQGANSFWAVCVDYLDSGPPLSVGKGLARGKIDYKDVLTPQEFGLFARLRDLRKAIAQTEAVPVYTIFTNEQLAEMVRSRARSQVDLEKIAGVGDARVTKYGTKFLALLTVSAEESDAAREKPV